MAGDFFEFHPDSGEADIDNEAGYESPDRERATEIVLTPTLVTGDASMASKYM